MTVKEVAALAAANLGREDLAALVSSAGETVTDGELVSLLRAYNLVENEIALDYFPLKKTEFLTPENGKLYYARFSSCPVTVHRITAAGRVLNYELFPDHVRIDCDGEVEALYSYAPARKSYADDSEFSNGISARLMSFGVACEFCLTQGLYEEAAAWECKFRDALRSAGILRRTLALRSRRWE